MIYFHDCNHPGIIYRGTSAQMSYLENEGGQPEKISFDTAEALCVNEEWSIKDAPEHWTK
jgi:hypothetical protein